MAAAALTYSEPFRVSLGGRFFTMTTVTVEATNEEYVAKGIPISYEKLGLPDALVDSIFAPAGLLDEKNEKQYDVAIIKEKMVLIASGKEKEFNVELAANTKLAKYSAMVVALGR
jgi:hypothetical protein